jgi:hypothetical protein
MHRAAHGGSMMTPQMFDPSNLPPATGFFSPAAPSSAPTYSDIRPPLLRMAGGARSRRGARASHLRTRGGFVPSVMGGFIPNAQAAIVPAAMYMVYHTMIPKKGGLAAVGGKAWRSIKRTLRKSRILKGGKRV